MLGTSHRLFHTMARSSRAHESLSPVEQTPTDQILEFHACSLFPKVTALDRLHGSWGETRPTKLRSKSKTLAWKHSKASRSAQLSRSPEKNSKALVVGDSDELSIMCAYQTGAQWSGGATFEGGIEDVEVFVWSGVGTEGLDPRSKDEDYT